MDGSHATDPSPIPQPRPLYPCARLERLCLTLPTYITPRPWASHLCWLPTAPYTGECHSSCDSPLRKRQSHKEQTENRQTNKQSFLRRVLFLLCAMCCAPPERGKRKETQQIQHCVCSRLSLGSSVLVQNREKRGSSTSKNTLVTSHFRSESTKTEDKTQV